MYELLSKRIKNADGELEVFTYNSFPQAFRNLHLPERHI